MRRILIFTAASIIWLFFSAGCNNTEEVIVGPVQASINSAINLLSFERVDPAGRRFEFRCLTDSIYDCSNYSIDFELVTAGDTFKLNFNELFRPAFCVPPDKEAFALVNLGELTNGTYQLPVTVNNIVATAVLTVTDSTFEITGGDSTWTNFTRPTLRRIPANTIWGQIGYPSVAAYDSAISYLDSLLNIGAAPLMLTGGSYGYFWFDGSGNPDSILELGTTIPSALTIPYVHTYAGDTAALHSLVTLYANQGNVVEVNVITSDGIEFKSW